MDPTPEMKRNRFPSMNFEAEILTAPHDNSELYVIPSMRSLTAEEYVEAFKSFLDHSTEHQCMEEFNREEMPNIMASLGNGKSTINVLGVGSGTGEQDLKMIRVLQAAHPGVLIDNEIIEPNPQHVAAYKELVNQAPDLQNVSFIWHQLTSSEYEQQVKEKGAHKKFDFIHMIQMLYRVEDIPNTIKFFHSCLDHDGKLLIIILSDSSGWASLWKKYRHCLPSTDSGHYITSNGITDVLKRLGVVYRVYEFSSGWDITECFIEGDPVGGHMMDFLTGTKNFLGTAPPGLRRQLQEALCQPECSSRRDGRIIFSNNLSRVSGHCNTVDEFMVPLRSMEPRFHPGYLVQPQENVFQKVQSSISLKAYMDSFLMVCILSVFLTLGFPLFYIASMFTYLKACLYGHVLLCSQEEAAAPMLAAYRPTASGCTRTKPARCPRCFAPK